ncbi:MAG: NifU family protein [Rothia sp. (in: high G+C Gram-positive bacteria)]|nr:NifU family protein [Rothia sp. (in: high G+C Gram-positive bacteria)]
MRVLLHPERTDHPAEIRWVVPNYPGNLEQLASHPDGPLAQLLSSGQLLLVRGGPGQIITRAPSAEAWRELGGLVRRALEDSLAPLFEPRPEEQAEAAEDLSRQEQTLRDLAPQVLDRYVRPLAGAHGGTIEITRIQGKWVWVYLDGACRGCPAATFTLQQRFERELNRRLPGSRVKEDRQGPSCPQPGQQGSAGHHASSRSS